MNITEEMVRKLQPGDELDALVEQYVFGAQWQSAKAAVTMCEREARTTGTSLSGVEPVPSGLSGRL